MMRAAIYARVSTAEQNPQLQLDELERYATARSVDVVGKYVDHGVSGAKSNRPACCPPVQRVRIQCST